MSRPRAILVRLVVIVAVCSATAGAYALVGTFGATAATYSVGGIDVRVDSKGFYNNAPYPSSSWSVKDLQPYYDQFFDFADIKPGDRGTTTISIHLKKAPGWVCLSFDDFKDKENGRNEPERWVDATNTTGELGKGLEFFAWRDDGDNKFEVGEKPLFGTSTQSAIQTVKNKTYALADYKNGPAWTENSTHYVGIAWCAGNLTVNVAAGKVSCDGSVLGNDAQTDSLSFSVALEAVPSTQEKKFVCGGSSSNHGHDNDYPGNHEYSWYEWGDDDGHGGSCNVGRH